MCLLWACSISGITQWCVSWQRVLNYSFIQKHAQASCKAFMAVQAMLFSLSLAVSAQSVSFTAPSASKPNHYELSYQLFCDVGNRQTLGHLTFLVSQWVYHMPSAMVLMQHFVSEYVTTFLGLLKKQCCLPGLSRPGNYKFKDGTPLKLTKVS